MNKPMILYIILVIVIVLGSVLYFHTKFPTTIDFKQTGGCGNFLVYKYNNDNTIGISVNANKDILNLSTTEQTFEIGKTDGLSVEVLIGTGISSEFYCNDVLNTDQPKSKIFTAKNGIAIISISKIMNPESEWKWYKDYTATVILKDVHFIGEDSNNSDIIIDELIFKDVRVGWLPG